MVPPWKSNLFYLQANSCWPLSELRFWTGWCCCRGRYFKEVLIYGPLKYCLWRDICAYRESNNNSVLTRIPGDSWLKSKSAFTHNSATDDDSVLLGHQNHRWGPAEPWVNGHQPQLGTGDFKTGSHIHVSHVSHVSHIFICSRRVISHLTDAGMHDMTPLNSLIRGNTEKWHFLYINYNFKNLKKALKTKCQ